MRDSVDFGLRLVFFAFAPFFLVLAAAIFPVTGALLQVGLGLLVFFVGEAARRVASRSRIATALLRSQLGFEAFYREHPPYPFLYYVFYPFLFPYWLWDARARREFLLYKGYTLASFAMLVVSLVFQYASAFPPELGLKAFGPIALGTFAAETVVVLTFLLPAVTTVVHFHRTGARKRLAILLGVGVVSLSVAGVRLVRKRDPIVSFATRRRVQLRTDAKPNAASYAMEVALRDAWKIIPKAKGDVDSDGKVEGAPLETARSSLGRFYKNDETYAVDLWYARKGPGSVLVIYFEARRGRGPIWLAMDRAGNPIRDASKLPRGAFLAMRLAAD
ncbi:MAG: hypothetical protein U0169_23325 [Polyangiaceae bacterium]